METLNCPNGIQSFIENKALRDSAVISMRVSRRRLKLSDYSIFGPKIILKFYFLILSITVLVLQGNFGAAILKIALTWGIIKSPEK